MKVIRVHPCNPWPKQTAPSQQIIRIDTLTVRDPRPALNAALFIDALDVTGLTTQNLTFTLAPAVPKILKTQTTLTAHTTSP